MNKTVLLCFLLFLLIALFCKFGVTADFGSDNIYDEQSSFISSNTIWVPDNYTTIQEAINHANEGDTIFVRPATYYEKIVIGKSISIIGVDKFSTVLDGHQAHWPVEITANNVTFSGFTVANSCGIFGYGGGGIYLMSSNDCVITDNILKYNQYGIGLYGSSNNIINNNYLTENSVNILVRAREVYDNNETVTVPSRKNTFINNTLTRADWGAFRLCELSESTIIGNSISDNQFGIVIEDWIEQPTNITAYHNNLINNTEQAISAGICPWGKTVWDDGYPSGGNYWSDYSGNDTNSGPFQNETGSDGIGDTPRIINAANVDHYPLMHPWKPVHNIDTGLRYSTIQEAINANETLNGHTIFVSSGTYNENVVVDKPVTLIGENKVTTIIDGNDNGSVITIVTGNVTITGFRIQNGSFAGVEFGWAGDLWAVGNCNISNNIITGTGMGIWISFGSSNNIISGNTIIGGGISLWDFSCSNRIVGNNITGDGIGLWRAMGNTISENNIERKSGWCGGITLSYYSEYNSVFDNNIKDARTWGFWLSDLSVGNKIFRNNVVNCDGGIWISCSDNTFYHNNFVNSSRVDIIRGASNVWDNGAEGNYWSNYTGADSDHDGIGDTPHVLDGSNKDNHPLMGIFSSFTALEHEVNVISNSTIEDLQYFISNSTIVIHVSNTTTDQTFGFCRICIPHTLINKPYQIVINGAEPHYVNYTLADNGTHRWIYFNYQHSTLEIVIVPEFPSLIILPLLIITTLLTTLTYRKKHPKATHTNLPP